MVKAFKDAEDQVKRETHKLILLEKPIFAELGGLKYEQMLERRAEMVGMGAAADEQSGG